MFIFRQKSACGSFFVGAFAPWNDLDCIVLTDEEKLELVVGWILTSCQPHRVTSGCSNSVKSKCTLQNSSQNFINPFSSQPTKQIATQT